jgi:hypothetical protein
MLHENEWWTRMSPLMIEHDGMAFAVAPLVEPRSVQDAAFGSFPALMRDLITFVVMACDGAQWPEQGGLTEATAVLDDCLGFVDRLRCASAQCVARAFLRHVDSRCVPDHHPRGRAWAAVVAHHPLLLKLQAAWGDAEMDDVAMRVATRHLATARPSPELLRHVEEDISALVARMRAIEARKLRFLSHDKVRRAALFF